MKTLEHPDLPGRSVTVDDKKAAVMARSGWVPVDDGLPVDVPDPDDTVDDDGV